MLVNVKGRERKVKIQHVEFDNELIFTHDNEDIPFTNLEIYVVCENRNCGVKCCTHATKHLFEPRCLLGCLLGYTEYENAKYVPIVAYHPIQEK